MDTMYSEGVARFHRYYFVYADETATEYEDLLVQTWFHIPLWNYFQAYVSSSLHIIDEVFASNESC